MARVRLEMYGQAEPLLSAALMRCRSEQPQRKELRYWLARAHEGTGRSAAALPLYRAVHRVDPAFMDTAARLAAIAEADGLDEGADLATVSASGFGQEAGGDLDPLAPLDPVDGRELLADRRGGRRPTPGWAPPAAGARRRGPGQGRGGRPARRRAAARRARRPGAAGEGAGGAGADGRHGAGQAAGAGAVGAAADGAAAGGPGPAGAAAETALRLLRPSGTGKTTVARILGRVFYALGLLGGDHLVEAQRADLVGEFLGQTAVKANELIDSALGGVLFVDEAYSLSNSGYSKGDAYGDEALQVLLKRAEDNRDRLVVILAGYPEGMDRLLAANPGLSSRFTTRVDFPSYRPLELTAIGEVLAAENGDRWDEESRDELCSISGHVVDQGWIDELGNGRFLRTLYEKSCAYRDLRLSTWRGTPTRDDLATLRLPDLMQAYGEVLSGRGPDPQGPPKGLDSAPAAAAGSAGQRPVVRAAATCPRAVR